MTQNLQDLNTLLRNMAAEGVNYLMVEAGATLSQSFLEQGLIDDLYWYRATKPMHKGISAFNIPPTNAKIIHEKPLGDDSLTVYRFTHPQTLLDS